MSFKNVQYKNLHEWHITRTSLGDKTFGGPNLRGPNLALKHQYSNKKGISQNGDFEEAL